MDMVPPRPGAAHPAGGIVSAVDVILVDDHEAFRSTLRAWLEANVPGIAVHETGTAEEALEIVPRVAPRLVLMDIGLPGLSGLEATRRLLDATPATSVVIVSIHETASHRAAAAAAGAVGYVAKSSLTTQLPPLLQRVLGDDQEPPS
jgi:DNA-binding NarL/FixJ family response regulator